MYECAKTEGGWMVYWGPPPRKLQKSVDAEPNEAADSRNSILDVLPALMLDRVVDVAREPVDGDVSLTTGA